MRANLFHPLPECRRGFSLVELLIVMGILMLLVAVSIPSLSGLKRGTDMQVAATRSIEQFQMARQLSRVKNRPVEMRLYTADKTALGAASIQLFNIKDDGTAEPAERRVVLPNTVAFSENTTFSDFLGTYSTRTNDAKYGDSYVFRFRAGGQPAVSVTGTPPVLTIMMRADVEQAASALPPNYVTIQLDPQTGRPRVFRP